jgi:hypothetical protein
MRPRKADNLLLSVRAKLVQYLPDWSGVSE